MIKLTLLTFGAESYMSIRFSAPIKFARIKEMLFMPERNVLNSVLVFFCILLSGYLYAGNYFVATTGSNTTGSGSEGSPWATIGYAASVVPDNGSTIIVKDGVYAGTNSISRQFANLLTIKAENYYKARLTTVVGASVCAVNISGKNILFKDFEIYNQGSGTDEYLIHISTDPCCNIILRNNIFHDNFYQDMMKINAGAHNITIEGNVFYNLDPTAEWNFMDVNTVFDVVIQDNIYFNELGTATSNGWVLIKNSDNLRMITKNNTIQRNVFLNWQGKPDAAFVQIGESGKPFYEAEDTMIQNNLFIGNSTMPVMCALGVKGCKGVTFRANTITGNMPTGGWSYATRINREGANLVNTDIYFYNNIWSDNTGTMTDFADGTSVDSTNVIYKRNLYWNGGNSIPGDGEAHFDGTSSDTGALVANPGLNVNQSSVVLPKWSPSSGKFPSGNFTIRQEFERLVNAYGAITGGSPAFNTAENINMPVEDILGNTRETQKDIGCFEYGTGSIVLPPTPAGSNPLANAKPFPNPFNPGRSRDGSLKFAYLPSNGPFKLQVFTSEGAKINEVTSSLSENLTWNAKDMDYNAVARGSYLCVITDESGNKKSLWVMLLK
ncbi:MAG: hypothetical protein A2231_10035 [Candidatus Firestonebacteria bacterium RIFOXYA2_FULL_40_8]|nr:MAG: hypothetical protein A2231_10035 [Candidatus Firestonebacteria bacterium RIFOXYA2_FULL_40_8]